MPNTPISENSKLGRVLEWVRKNRTPLLIGLLPGLLTGWLLELPRLTWRCIVFGYHALSNFLTLLQKDVTIKTGVLVVLCIVPLIMVFAVRYVLLYKYREDKFCGVRWKWHYSFPMGRVIKVRLFCPACREETVRPKSVLSCYSLASNFLCGNCGYNSLNHTRDEMPRDWDCFIQAKVDQQKTEE